MDMEKMLQFIEDHTNDKGYPPTLREIAKHLGIGVTAVIYRRDKLIDRGLLEYTPGIARSLRPIPQDGD